jgi:hypothetical protein
VGVEQRHGRQGDVGVRRLLIAVTFSGGSRHCGFKTFLRIYFLINCHVRFHSKCQLVNFTKSY